MKILRHHPTVKQIDDPVGKTCIVGRVRYHYDGGTTLLKLGEQVHHLQAIGGVEVTSRFVGEYDLGLGYHRPGNGYALLLSTG